MFTTLSFCCDGGAGAAVSRPTTVVRYEPNHHPAKLCPDEARRAVHQQEATVRFRVHNSPRYDAAIIEVPCDPLCHLPAAAEFIDQVLPDVGQLLEHNGSSAAPRQTVRFTITRRWPLAPVPPWA